MKKAIWLIIGLWLVITGSWYHGWMMGRIDADFWLSEYVRVITTPEIIDPNTTKYYKREAWNWRNAAEHYGGICKWVIENKPITGNTINEFMSEDGRTLMNFQAVCDGPLEISGSNSTVMDGEFRMWDMGWVNSLEAVDPNECLIECSRDATGIIAYNQFYSNSCATVLDAGSTFRMGNIWWPPIFIDENFEYSEEGELLVAGAIADGLTGWGNCYAGLTVPANFGIGMVKIGKITECFTIDELLTASEELISPKLAYDPNLIEI